jgi:hypothetical protein
MAKAEAKRIEKNFITLEYSKRAENVLKEHDIDFKREKLVELVNESEEAKKREEWFHNQVWFPIPPDLYNEIDTLCKFAGYDTDTHIKTILRRETRSAHIGETKNGKKIIDNF